MKLMHISYKEAMATPVKVVVRQMEFRQIENQIKEKKQKQQSNA